jgi:hypothetical protein
VTGTADSEVLGIIVTAGNLKPGGPASLIKTPFAELELETVAVTVTSSSMDLTLGTNHSHNHPMSSGTVALTGVTRIMTTLVWTQMRSKIAHRDSQPETVAGPGPAPPEGLSRESRCQGRRQTVTEGD